MSKRVAMSHSLLFKSDSAVLLEQQRAKALWRYEIIRPLLNIPFQEFKLRRRPDALAQPDWLAPLIMQWLKLDDTSIDLAVVNEEDSL